MELFFYCSIGSAIFGSENVNLCINQVTEIEFEQLNNNPFHICVN